MNILVFGGSPKGQTSVTIQYVNWLQQNCPGHNLEIVQVAQPVCKLENNPGAMDAIERKVRAADGILWAFPLYVAMPHAGLKRFIEMINESRLSGAFQGKHCAILTTSIHFYDHTAVEYMRGISEDLGMSVDEVFSAGMQDLTHPGGAGQLANFFGKWMGQIRQSTGRGRLTAPVIYESGAYKPSAPAPAPHPIRVGIVTQSGVNPNLDAMVKHISSCFSQVDFYDLTTMRIAGNCTGCLRCGYDNTCLYEGRDDVISTYRKLRECDAILFCGFVQDRYLSARWKTFVDRMFFSTHTPVLPGKPLGFVIAGPLRQLGNLRHMLEGVYGTMQMRPAGFATDEGGDTDGTLATLADSLHFLAQSGYMPPEQFPSVCGRRVFRDEIYGGLSGVFPADHRYYKQNGWYDFPQKNRGARVACLLMRNAMRLPSVRKALQDNMQQNMLLPFRKAVGREAGGGQ